MSFSRTLVAATAFLVGCGGGTGGGPVEPGGYAGTCELPPGLEIPPAPFDPGPDYVFNPDNLLLYELHFTDAEWERLCKVARDKAVAEIKGGEAEDAFRSTYSRARLRVGDEDHGDIGVRVRGDASVELLFFPYNGDDDPEPEFEDCLEFRFGRKPSFKLDFTQFGGHEFHGQHHVSLGGKEGGYSMMHDYLVSKLAASFGVVSPRVSHAVLCINDVYRGVFTVQEEHDDYPFLLHHFPNDPSGTYYKVHDPDSQTFHTDIDLNEYRSVYKPAARTSDASFTEETDLIQFLRFINFTDNTSFAQQAQFKMKVDAWLKIIAMEAVVPDDDGLFVGRHNYLLYHHPLHGWWPVRNDWDHAFEYAFLEDHATTGRRLLDLPKPGLPSTRYRNRCDGLPPLDDDVKTCRGTCTQSSVFHPIGAARILHAERERYIGYVETFLDDHFIPGTLKQYVRERRQKLDAYFRAPQGEQPWMRYDRWVEDMAILDDDIDIIHAQASAALDDLLANPPQVPPAEERPNMMAACGTESCWPHACPP